jgi:hypothetical protein
MHASGCVGALIYQDGFSIHHAALWGKQDIDVVAFGPGILLEEEFMRIDCASSPKRTVSVWYPSMLEILIEACTIMEDRWYVEKMSDAK